MPNVYLLTTGDGSDGDEWEVKSIHATRAGADRAKVDYETKPNVRGDGSVFYWAANEIEEWKLGE